MTVKPLADRVVVERAVPSDTSAGGLVLPDTAKEKPKQGIVIAAGPGRLLENGQLRPLDVSQGDEVLFGAYAGSEVKLDGKDYVILKEEEILAVVAK